MEKIIVKFSTGRIAAFHRFFIVPQAGTAVFLRVRRRYRLPVANPGACADRFTNTIAACWLLVVLRLTLNALFNSIRNAET